MSGIQDNCLSQKTAPNTCFIGGLCFCQIATSLFELKKPQSWWSLLDYPPAQWGLWWPYERIMGKLPRSCHCLSALTDGGLLLLPWSHDLLKQFCSIVRDSSPFFFKKIIFLLNINVIHIWICDKREMALLWLCTQLCHLVSVDVRAWLATELSEGACLIWPSAPVPLCNALTWYPIVNNNTIGYNR